MLLLKIEPSEITSFLYDNFFHLGDGSPCFPPGGAYAGFILDINLFVRQTFSRKATRGNVKPFLRQPFPFIQDINLQSIEFSRVKCWVKTQVLIFFLFLPKDLTSFETMLAVIIEHCISGNSFYVHIYFLNLKVFYPCTSVAYERS